MLKLIINNINSRIISNLPLRYSRLSFHVSQTTVSTQDYDISEELIDFKDPKIEKNKSDENPDKVPYEHPLCSTVLKNLRNNLGCSEFEAKELIRKHAQVKHIPNVKMSKRFKFLFDNKISTKAILESPFLLEYPDELLEKRLELLKKMDTRNINDFAPLMKLSTLKIKKISKIFESESSKIEYGNRIYYFAEKFEVEPMIVCQNFVRRPFIFEMNLEHFIRNSEILLKNQIDPKYILADLWGIRYTPEQVQARLELGKNASRENIRPWIIRCPDSILNRALEISKESKEVLGDRTMAGYIAERLGYDEEEVKSVLIKSKQILRTKPKSIKNVLDYLLLEEKFPPNLILSSSRVLIHSLETTRKRMEELRGLGYRPLTLSIFTKSTKLYDNFLIKLKRRNSDHRREQRVRNKNETNEDNKEE